MTLSATYAKRRGTFAEIPAEWSEAVLIPLHKNGDPGDPSNYRPIKMLFQARKIVESALDLAIKELYVFWRLQTGFQKYLSTATDTNRTADGIWKGDTYVAVLDLKAAYERVPPSHPVPPPRQEPSQLAFEDRLKSRHILCTPDQGP